MVDENLSPPYSPGMSDDVLVLTKADERNYHALCNAVHDFAIRRGNQRDLRDAISAGMKLRLLREQDYRCLDCGVEFVVRNGQCREATTEHVIPFRYGGQANRHNIVLLCGPCNLKRSENFSLSIIEAHYGPIDYSRIEKPTPTIRFFDEQTSLRSRAR